MNKEEIKSRYTMREVAGRYGFYPNRNGFIRCPFHNGDNDASLKLYKDSYYCFGCGASGDIFSFVQYMEHCDFKTAFQTLGGTYEKPSMKSKFALYRIRKGVEQRKLDWSKVEKKRELNNMLIDIYRNYMNNAKPFSDVWCDCCNALQYQLYIQEILDRKEVIR